MTRYLKGSGGHGQGHWPCAPRPSMVPWTAMKEPLRLPFVLLLVFLCAMVVLTSLQLFAGWGLEDWPPLVHPRAGRGPAAACPVRGDAARGPPLRRAARLPHGAPPVLPLLGFPHRPRRELRGARERHDLVAPGRIRSTPGRRHVGGRPGVPAGQLHRRGRALRRPGRGDRRSPRSGPRDRPRAEGAPVHAVRIRHRLDEGRRRQPAARRGEAALPAGGDEARRGVAVRRRPASRNSSCGTSGR